MKAFDPGGMEIIETLTSFPGVGESGQIGGCHHRKPDCFCLYSGSDDGLDR
jgi:hypothetical protein